MKRFIVNLLGYMWISILIIMLGFGVLAIIGFIIS